MVEVATFTKTLHLRNCITKSSSKNNIYSNNHQIYQNSTVTDRKYPNQAYILKTIQNLDKTDFSINFLLKKAMFSKKNTTRSAAEQKK